MRSKMVQRIVITGAECTGKSTLTQALSGYYGEPWTAEYVRSYVEQVRREPELADLPKIFAGQLTSEDAALNQATRCVLHDTNLLSSILYANHYFEQREESEMEQFLSRDYALYLLCSPEGVPWKADPGQRDSPEARDRLHAKFKESLDTLQLPYIELTGASTARFGEAVRAIDGLLGITGDDR
ncbi:MAG: NadR-like protein [Puniceicoccaceae bacterium]|nr:MAG: NadR-like protein [Puniceicoccaceae bacterium]